MPDVLTILVFVTYAFTYVAMAMGLALVCVLFGVAVQTLRETRSRR